MNDKNKLGTSTHHSSFTTHNSLVPKLRFPEFREAGEWNEKPLGKICDVLNNCRKPITSSNRVSGPYPYYGASGIVDYVNDFIFDGRLLLIGEDGAKWGAYEKTAFIVAGKYWVNNHAHVLKPFGVNDTLLENYLTMLDLGPFITGAAPPKLTLGKLKEVPVPVPSLLGEQQKIADCFASIDELITLEAQKLDTLKTHKKGLMQQLFPAEGETLPRLRFPEFRTAREWIECDFYDLLEDVLDFRGRTPLKLGMDWGGGSIISLSANNVKNGYIDFDAECNLGSEALYEKWMGKVNLEKGDIVFTMEAPLGNALLVPDSRRYILSQRVVAFKTKKDISSEFLIQLIWSPEFQNEMERLSTGSTAKGINQKTLKNVSVRVPSEENEQQKIADGLSSIDELITAQTQKLDTLKAHKRGLMQQLFPSFGGVDDETERGGHPVGDEAQG
ncbi:type I restriction enzyme, S subunit [Nitrosomonas ureae]|uniref:Type I restriction enzyme, S subunit n=1 Tax=Nitrosomonas ureae TaxID=44577 RepID=A0A285BZ85_9PROT|nr:restriction endonuclease subunit S [Nitrosomonas ureae]SNX60582.1 type I restriction enzyme, S subunit [Nitrosomonas ureae]